jgi:hypothetical protein
VPFGSQTLNHEKLEFLPGTFRAATTRPLSEAATANHFSVSPAPFTTGVARRAFCVPSSDDSQTSPPSTYAIEAAPAAGGSVSSTRIAISVARMAAQRKPASTGAHQANHGDSPP